MSKQTLVLGIGNTLLSDEGIGVHVVEHLAGRHGDLPGVTFMDGGTLGFMLAEALAHHQRLVVVDAARMDREPGAVGCYEGTAMERYLKGNRQSVHEVGLVDLLDMAHLSDHYPERIALIGVEPLTLQWGESPSAPVADAIEPAGNEVMQLVQRWQAEDDQPVHQ